MNCNIKIAFTLLFGAVGLLPAQPATESAFKFPAISDVFVVALFPGSEQRPYFTLESLKAALPYFKPIIPHHKVGGKRMSQSGVIVLKTKEVLFWSTSYPGEIRIIDNTGPGHSFGIPGKWHNE